MDISLAMLELAINSLDAGATLVKISLRATRSGASLTIADNGKGMSDEELARARERGFSSKGGSGLGLYKTEQAAKASGGYVKIRSSRGGVKVRVKAKSCETGDIASTLAAICEERSDVVLRARIGKSRVLLDTRRVKEQLGGASIEDPAALAAIKKYVNEILKK